MEGHKRLSRLFSGNLPAMFMLIIVQKDLSFMFFSGDLAALF